MTVAGASSKNAGLPAHPSPKGAGALREAPSSAEWWFVYVVLVATALIPGLVLKYELISQTFVQVFWSITYVIAGWQLLRMGIGLPVLVRRFGLLFALIGLMFASALWSIDPYTTIIDSIELLGTTVITLYIAARFTLAEFLWIVAMAFATIGFVSVVIVFGNPGFGREHWGSGAWQGIFDDKNTSGAMASIAIICNLVLLPLKKGWARSFLIAGLLLNALLLIESNSATAFSSCAFVIVTALAALGCRSRKFGAFARFVTVVGVAIALVSIFVFGMSADTIYAALGRSSDLTTRSDFWPYLQQAIADRPIFGYGFDAFFQSSLAREYLQPFIVQAGGWAPYHAHESFLQTLLDAGYIGLAALIALIVFSLRGAIGYFMRERSSLGIWPLLLILYLTIGSYTETYYLNYNSIEWILFVAAIAYPRHSTPRV